jgi:hypothetical protein
MPLLVPELGNAREPQFSDTSITRGRTAAGFPYMNGGLISDEQQAMERRSRRYNLKVVVATPLRRFVSPVLLLIGNNQSGRIEKVHLHAPWFYIQLPSGAYTILARLEKRLVLIRDVYLREDRRATYFVR